MSRGGYGGSSFNSPAVGDSSEMPECDGGHVARRHPGAYFTCAAIPANGPEPYSAVMIAPASASCLA
jgi:hypothetical protein